MSSRIGRSTAARRLCAILAPALAAALSIVLAPGGAQAIDATTPAYPLRVAPSGRHLVDRNGVPFRIQGDAAWSLISNLTLDEADSYLADRQARGFNAVLVNLLEHKFAVNAPANRSGDFPFTAHSPGSYDFSKPNEAYFAFADAVLERCAARGIAVFLAIMWAGNAGGDEGWWSELTNSVNSRAIAHGYGRYLANRWKSRSNIVWVLGGDLTPPAGSEGEARLLAIYQGLRDGGATQLVTAHNSPSSLSTDWRAFASRAQLDGIYPGGCGSCSYDRARAAYARSRAKPTFLLEAGYEAEGWAPGDPASIRAYAWWTQLSSIAGVFYGHRDVWPFHTERWNSGYPFGARRWQLSLGAPGAVAMGQMASLLRGFAWQDLVPSGLSGTRRVIVAGGGTYGRTDHVVTAATASGSVLLAYVPDAHSGPVTIDMSVMSGTARARWWDPMIGAYALISASIANKGGKEFTVPGANSAGAKDWLLVVDVGGAVPDGHAAPVTGSWNRGANLTP